MGLKQIINEEIEWYDIDQKLYLLKSYIHILNNSDTGEGDYDTAKTYFIILHNFLIIERMFAEDVKQAGKEINNNLDLSPLNTPEEVMNLFTTLYDQHHPVRFGVETLDSIEPIRVYLNNNSHVYRELMKK